MKGGTLGNIDLTPGQLKLVKKLLRKHLPDTEVWAYGSRVKFSSRPDSDLDMVAFATPEQATDVMLLKEAFEESDLPFTVDFFVWDEVPDNFHKTIKREHFILQKMNGKVPAQTLPSGDRARPHNPAPRQIMKPAMHTPHGWIPKKVSDIAQINAEAYSPKENWGLVNYFDTSSVTKGVFSDAQSIPGDQLPSRARRKIRDGDIVYSTVRPNQRHYGIIKNPPANTLVSTGFAVVRGKQKVCDTRFLYYALTQGTIVEYLQNIAEQNVSAYPAVLPKDLASLEILLPPLREQRAIAHILGTLDDKIELNRQMSQTLEAMAQALFKSWFIDFDPVHAKAAGRDSGLPKSITDLFPDRFEDSELGPIPTGWQSSRISDAFGLTMGQSPPGESYNEVGDGLPFYQGRADFQFRFPGKRVYCTQPTRLANAGDTLVSVRAPVGDINMALEDCAIGRGVAAIRHKSDSRSYTYHFMRSLTHIFAPYKDDGTVFGSISKKDFQAIPCLNPPQTVIQAFEQLCAPMDSQVDLNERTSCTLSSTRDTMLPNLLSGRMGFDGQAP